jgi:protein-tyrosine phosphatase
MPDYPDPRRHVSIDGAKNIRDLGGYLTSEGGSVRWGIIFRADNVGSLKPRSQTALTQYGIRTVIDLRRDSQIEALGNVFAARPDVTFYHHPMVTDATDEEMMEASMVARKWIQRMEDLEGPQLRAANYCMRLDTRQEAIRETLSTLASLGTLPALFHCQAGKDRAGIMAALVLGIARVTNKTIVEDYELSGYYRWRGSLLESGAIDPDKNNWREADEDPEYEAFRLDSPAETMVEVLQYLEDKYGGIEGYVKEIGVRKEEIRALREAVVE